MSKTDDTSTDLTPAQAAVNLIRYQLLELEWLHRPHDDFYHEPAGYRCPECDAYKDKGHKDNCDLAKAIASLDAIQACVDRSLPAAPGPKEEAGIQAEADAIMEKIPTVARIYYTGKTTRRYHRASVHPGPGEPLVHRSHAERELKLLLASIKLASKRSP